MKDLADILKKIKLRIKEWRRETKIREDHEINEATKEVEAIEKMAESRSLTATERRIEYKENGR